MANEISVTTQLQVSNAGSEETFKPQAIQLTQTGKGVYKATLSITTSDTALSFTGITTPFVASFYNLDATNFVSVGPTSGGAIVDMLKLYPRGAGGFPNMLSLDPSATIRMQADTATCQVQIIVVEK